MVELGFTHGSLWRAVCQTCNRARETGALLPIPTDAHVLDRDGLPFLVRIVSHLARKPRPANELSAASCPNPFLPYDERLHVADASPTHVCLLNKFMVVDRHLLVVTRAFEHQQAPLTLDDFAAICRCLHEYDGLAFYNSGAMAGASQPHKHLQYVPLPLIDQLPDLPIERLLGEASSGVGRCSQVPFEHAFVQFTDDLFENPETAATTLCDYYLRMTRQLGLQVDTNTNRIYADYNLLLTRRWMLMVPRAAECFQEISLNSMAFAGALLVHNEDQLDQVRASSWLSILQSVTKPPPSLAEPPL
jgi:ATP adenylyltransferase